MKPESNLVTDTTMYKRPLEYQRTVSLKHVILFSFHTIRFFENKWSGNKHKFRWSLIRKDIDILFNY